MRQANPKIKQGTMCIFPYYGETSEEYCGFWTGRIKELWTSGQATVVVYDEQLKCFTKEICTTDVLCAGRMKELHRRLRKSETPTENFKYFLAHLRDWAPRWCSSSELEEHEKPTQASWGYDWDKPKSNKRKRSPVIYSENGLVFSNSLSSAFKPITPCSTKKRSSPSTASDSATSPTFSDAAAPATDLQPEEEDGMHVADKLKINAALVKLAFAVQPDISSYASLVLDHPKTMRTSKALRAAGFVAAPIVVPNRDISVQAAQEASYNNVEVLKSAAFDYLKTTDKSFKFMYLDYCGIFYTFARDLPHAFKRLDTSGSGAIFAVTYTKVHGGVPASVAQKHIEEQAKESGLHSQFVELFDYGTMYTLAWVMRPTYKI